MPTVWTDLGFAAFVIYATVRAFLGTKLLGAAVPLLDSVLLTLREHGLRGGIESLLAAIPAGRLVASRTRPLRCRSCWPSG